MKDLPTPKYVGQTYTKDNKNYIVVAPKRSTIKWIKNNLKRYY